MDTLPDWLRLAVSCGSTQWVRQFIQTYLPRLKDQQLSAAEFAQALDEELQARQLDSPARQRNYRSNVVQAIKSALASDHPAIALVGLTTEQYRELNDIARGRLADRETRYFSSDQAEAIVGRATGLLDSAELTEVAAGLAVLIGRRISEILLSSFELRSPWSLAFSQMSKKAVGQGNGLTIEIPTLAPADGVLRAIERLQSRLKIDDLDLEGVGPKGAKQRVNQRYSEPVAARVVQHFSDLVPARSDRENLYTHIFRAVYATIAAHWFCPPSVPEHNFKAEIQGHFTLSAAGQKLPNYSARASYDDYAVGTPDGNRDGRLGIKLGRLPGLELLEVFRKPQQAPISLFIAPPSTEAQLTEAQQSDAQQAEAQQAEAQLTEAQQSETQQAEAKPVHQPEEVSMSLPTEKPKTKRPELYAADLDRLTALMAKRGTTGAAAELFHALLEVFESGQDQQQQQQAQTIDKIAQTFNWLTDEIQSLRGQLSLLQQERDRLMAQQPATEELHRLQRENAQLKQELTTTQSRLTTVQQALGMPSAQPAPAATPAGPALLVAPVEVQPTQLAPAQPAAAQPLAAQSAAGQSPTAPTRRDRGETTDKLNQIVDAIISWNSAQPDGDTQLRVSIPAIKGIAAAMGASYQAAIQEVMKLRASELEQHHSQLMLGTRHNAGVRRKDDILQQIAKNYLALENWQDVKYQG